MKERSRNDKNGKSHFIVAWNVIDNVNKLGACRACYRKKDFEGPAINVYFLEEL